MIDKISEVQIGSRILASEQHKGVVRLLQGVWWWMKKVKLVGDFV